MRLRSALIVARWRLYGAHIGHGVTIWGRVAVIGDLRRLTIADDVTLNEGVVIELRNRVSIGARCRLSSGAKFHTGYLVRDEIGRLSHLSAPIEIGDDVWIATEAVITAGVTIASRITIAANAVVVRSLDEHGVYGGSPARLLRPTAT